MMRPGETVMTDFESIVEAFEAALQDASLHSSSSSSSSSSGSGGKVSIRDFLPDEGDPLYMDVLQELIRIDMEFHFSESQPVSLDDYRSEFPQAFTSPERVEPLAFEEYRLSLQTDHPAVAADYAVRYGIDVSHWPVAASISPMSVRGSRHSLAGAPHRIPDCAARIAVGDDLLDFRIVGELGRGAFARVFLAEQRSLSDRLVVLKVSAARLKEAEKLAQLQHTNIVPIYSVHPVEDASVICSCRGVPRLEKLLQNELSFPEISVPSGATLNDSSRGASQTVADSICRVSTVSTSVATDVADSFLRRRRRDCR